MDSWDDRGQGQEGQGPMPDLPDGGTRLGAAEVPDPDREEVPFGFSLTDLHMRLSIAFHLMRSCNHATVVKLGLGPGQPRMLSYLAVHGTSAQRDIARYYGIDPAAVSRMLDSLVKGGFVQVVPGKDRRCRAVELTDKGRAAVVKWDRMCARLDRVMVEGLSAEERVQLDDLLGRVAKNLSSYRNKSADDDTGDECHA